MSVEREMSAAVWFMHAYGRHEMPHEMPHEYRQAMKDFTFHERYGQRMTYKERALSRILERNKRVNLQQLLVAYDNFYK